MLEGRRGVVIENRHLTCIFLVSHYARVYNAVPKYSILPQLWGKDRVLYQIFR